MILVVQLGTIDYATGLRLQQRLVEMRKENRIRDVLLLLEHTPVITLGRNAKPTNVLKSPDELARRGVEVFACDRGGDVTFHGPGQLVGYPIFDLRGFESRTGNHKTLGAVEFVRRLEEVVIKTCAQFGVSTERVEGLTGVWTRRAASEPSVRLRGARTEALRGHADRSGQGKLASLGVHISRAVTSHGFALNVNTDLDYFNLIVPCGIASKPVTSLRRELGVQLDQFQVAEKIAGNFGTVFETQVRWIDTLETLLGNAVGVPVKPPAEIRKLHGEEETYWA